jgi:hypothetical protein
MRDGTVLPALKLGRKKRMSFMCSTRRDIAVQTSGTAHPRDSVLEFWRRDMAAVQVAEAESR